MNPDEPAAPPSPEAAAPGPTAREEHPLIAWLRAIVLGVGDTARDMLEAGRRGSREAMDEGWQRYDAKTKHRRRRP
jgi:hypothetical protein